MIMASAFVALSLLNRKHGSVHRCPKKSASAQELYSASSSMRTLSSCKTMSFFLAAYMAQSMRRERRWWAIHRTLDEQQGFWEKKVPMWHKKAAMRTRQRAADYIDKRYLRTFRLDERTFKFVVRRTRDALTHQVTNCRMPVCAEKRLAMTLHWLAHSKTFDDLGELYCVGASTAHAIVHETVAVLKNVLLRQCIRFPSGQELRNVLAGFQALADLPQCAGAIDGTFIHMLKPSLWGDTYWCYKNYIAIIMVAVCDHRCRFTFVDVGRAGCVGDAFTYGESSLRRKVHGGRWLNEAEVQIEDVVVKPFLIGDSAFPLEPQLMKCYDNPQYDHQTKFNKALISSRQKIENAFGFLKGRWHVLVDNHIRDPTFMRDVALACTALHNICQRANCQYSDTWNVQHANYVPIGPGHVAGPPADVHGAGDVRWAIASSL